jgi:DNA polymerase-4
VSTLSDVRARSSADLQALVGSLAEWLLALAHGQDDRPVEPNRPSKSSGSECTYAEDLTRMSDVRREVDEMARDAASWLERKALFARTVVLKVRYSDFTTVTRSHSTRAGTRSADEIATRALALLDRTDAGHRPVRLLGVSVHGFADSPQPVTSREPDATATLPFD